MSTGSFLSGLAGGYTSGEGIKERRKERGVLEEMSKQREQDYKRPGEEGYRGSTPFVPQDGGTGQGGGYDAFNRSLARTESGGRYDVVNDEGYTGKYQFGQARLDDYNRATGAQITTDTFRTDPQMQERVQAWHVGDIDSYVDQNGLDQYIGREIGGVPITRDGLRAMAHLGGKGGMRKFVTSGGQYNPADSNGTALSDYARTHANATPTTQRGVMGRGKSLVSQYYK